VQESSCTSEAFAAAAKRNLVGNINGLLFLSRKREAEPEPDPPDVPALHIETAIRLSFVAAVGVQYNIQFSENGKDWSNVKAITGNGEETAYHSVRKKGLFRLEVIEASVGM
jgi:hypothetical protein